MKKQALFASILLGSVLLAGCEMPFATTEKETLAQYVDAQAKMVQASLEMDAQLQSSLQGTLKETEKKDFPAEQLINEIRSAKKTQQALYQRVQAQKEPYGKDAVKQLYLGVIGTHVDSYTQYEEQLKKKNRTVFGTVLAQNQIKEENVLEQSLILLNQELVYYKIEPRETLLPIEGKKDSK